MRVRVLDVLSLGLLFLGCSNQATFNGKTKVVKGSAADTSPGSEAPPAAATGTSGTETIFPGGVGPTTPPPERPDPCAGRTLPTTHQSSARKVLFYAPSNYHYGTNVYASSVKDALHAAGFEVTLVSGVNEGVSFDECNLTRSFKQIWLYLPCNNRQRMDSASFEALKKYYEHGSGLVLFSDMHYFDNSNPNTHCSSTTWRGTAAAPGDAIRVGRDILNMRVDIDLQNAGAPMPPADHLLSASVSLAARVARWAALSLDTQSSSPDMKVLGLRPTTFRPVAGIIDKTSEARAVDRRLALAFASNYCYHCNASAEEKSAYRLVAEYVDQKVLSNAAAAFSLAGELPLVLPRIELPPEESLAALQARLGAADKHDVGDALLRLSLRGGLTFESLLPFLEHETFFVRAHALTALAQIADAEATRREVLRLLPGSVQRFRLAQNLIRATSLMGIQDAVPVLQGFLSADIDVRLKAEAAVALTNLRGDKAVSDLVPLLGVSNPALLSVVITSLERLGISRVSNFILDSFDKLNYSGLEE